MRTAAFAPVLLVMASSAALGCGSNVESGLAAATTSASSGATTTKTATGAGGGATTTTSTVTETAAGGAGGGTGGAGGAEPAIPYPAPHPAMPVMPNHGGAVLHDPVLVTVTWAGDELEQTLQTFDDTIGTLAWWPAIHAQYGINPSKGGGHVVVQDPAPADLSDADIQQWLVDHVTDKTLPAPTDQTVYVLYYPGLTTITLDPSQGGGQSCTSFGGYHESLTVTGPSGPVEVAYAVLPRCGPQDELTVSASHEITEAATDPHPDFAPGYAIMDPHSPWAPLGGEDADLCELVGGTSEAGYALARAWSNENAKKGDQPCMPVPAGPTPFFDAGIVKERLKAKPGDTVTTPVECYSFGPLANDISLDAMNKSGALTFSFDKPTCKNGDVVTLSIKVSPSAKKATDYRYRLNATLDAQNQHIWRGVVMVQ
jgi:hypothetical protein